MDVKKHLVYGAILFIWIFVPVYMSIIGSLGTDIVQGTCAPWGAYSSYAAEKTMITSVFVITYLLPLILMVFCYCRIVYALRCKVIAYFAFLPSVCLSRTRVLCDETKEHTADILIPHDRVIILVF